MSGRESIHKNTGHSANSEGRQEAAPQEKESLARFGTSLTAQQIVQMQRTYGNRAVGQILQRKASPRSSESQTIGNVGVMKISSNGGHIQRKWVKFGDQTQLLRWDSDRGGLRWYYNEGTSKMYFDMEDYGQIDKEVFSLLKTLERKQKSREEWEQIWKEHGWPDIVDDLTLSNKSKFKIFSLLRTKIAGTFISLNSTHSKKLLIPRNSKFPKKMSLMVAVNTSII